MQKGPRGPGKGDRVSLIMRQDKPDGPRVPPRRFSDLRIRTFQAIEKACAALGGRAFYRHTFLAAGRFDLREEVLPVPAELAGDAPLTIAQLSDLHAGPFLARGDLGPCSRIGGRWRILRDVLLDTLKGRHDG